MNLRPRTLTALPLALAIAAAAPAAAHAADLAHFVEYSADTDITVQHHFSQYHQGEFGGSDRAVDSTSRVRSHFGQLTFQNDEKVQLLSGVSATAHAKNQGAVVAHTFDGLNKQTENCAPVDNDWGSSNIEPAVLEPLGTGTEITFAIGSEPRPDWTCSGDQIGAHPDPLFDYEGNQPEGRGPWDTTLSVSKEDMGYGKILQRVTGPPAASAGFCPGTKQPYVTSCSFSWSGWITLIKTGETVVESEPDPSAGGADTAPPAQTGSGAPAGAQSPSGTGAAGDGDRPRLQAPKVDPKTGDVTLSVTCPAGCRGAATLTVPKAAAGRASATAAAAKPLATLRFAAKAGRSTVRLRFPAKAKKAMRRAGRGKLKVTLSPKGGAPATRTFGLKIRKR